jgi:hypothetical protein
MDRDRDTDKDADKNRDTGNFSVKKCAQISTFYSVFVTHLTVSDLPF